MIDAFRDKYFFLSNFYEAPITYNGITYKNNEAAFQAQKCISAYQIAHGEKVFTDERTLFINLSARDAKRLGRKVDLRSDWERVKVGIMKDIVRAKFTQNEDLRDKLLETKDELLCEGNTWGDRIWGTVNGVGRNLLGQILMDVREEILEKEQNMDELQYI